MTISRERIATIRETARQVAPSSGELEALCDTALLALTQLEAAEARLKRFDDTWPDAVLCAEWAATVALQSSDVYQAAKRYLAGEQSPAAAHLERIKKACELDATEARAYVQSSSAVSTDFFPWVLGRVLQRIKETVDGQ